jgi:hypothetical protein
MANDIEGLPEGATVRPARQSKDQTSDEIVGLPKGATVRPFAPATPRGTEPNEVEGLPEGATLRALDKQSGETEKKPGLAERTDKAITDALAPNPKNLANSKPGSFVGNTGMIKEEGKTLGRELYSGAKTIAGIVPSVYHAFADKPTTEELARDREQGSENSDTIGRIGLGAERLVRGVTEPVVQAAKDYAGGKVGYDQILENAPEAMGTGAATYVAGKAAPELLKSVPKVIEGTGDLIRKGSSAVSDAKDAAKSFYKPIELDADSFSDAKPASNPEWKARTSFQPISKPSAKVPRIEVPNEPGLVGNAYVEPKAAAVEAKVEGPGFKKMVDDIGEQVRVATGGAEPLRPNIPLREQNLIPEKTTAEAPVAEKPTEPVKLSSEPRKAVLQRAGATPEEIDTILPKGARPGQTGLTKVEMSRLAEHFDVDLGQSAIGRGKGDIAAGTHTPQHEVLQRIIDTGHSPSDIARAIDNGAHLPKASGGSPMLDVMKQAEAAGPSWTTDRAGAVMERLNKTNPRKTTFDVRGSVAERGTSSNDMDVYVRGSLSDAKGALKDLGFTKSHSTPHGEVWTNDKTGQALDFWTKTEPKSGFNAR